MAKVWALLSGERQIIAFRQRLLSRDPGRRVYVNVEFFNFYTLYRRLLADAGRPQRCMDDAARYGLIRAVCASEDLRLYRRIAHTSGFIRIVAEFIYELKQNIITPEMLAPLMVVEANWIEATLKHIDDTYGSVENYLREKVGLDDATLEAIRVNLLQ